MKRLSKSKQKELLSALKKYRKKYLSGKYAEADEAGTRLMINEFLMDILGYVGLDEIKTEYMIRGTYADYVIQMKGKRYFIVEVKAMSIDISPKHLRQTIGYAANEGIDWALLTNGKIFELYRVIFDKPIESRKVFSFDLSNKDNLKKAADCFQYMRKDLIRKRGMDCLWNRTSALDINNLARFLYAKPIINNLRRNLRRTFRTRFSDDEISHAITRIIEEKVENVTPVRNRSRRKKSRVSKPQVKATPVTATPSMNPGA